MTKVLEFFTDFKYNGRFVNVEITENKGRDRKRKKGRGRRNSESGRKNNSFRSDKSSSKRGKKKNLGSSRPRRSRR